MLQSRAGLDPSTPWTDVPVTPVTVGGEFQVQQDNVAMKFYRLVQRGSGGGVPANLEPMLRRSGSGWIVAWPSTAQGYVLQSRAGLDPSTPWTDVPVTPVIVGGEFQVQQDNAAVKFYRLVQRGSGGGVPANLEPTLRRSGSGWIVAWPSTAQGYVLQSRAGLDPSTPWTDVPVTPVIVGGEFQVQQDNVAVKFYRLVQRGSSNAAAATAGVDFVVSQGVLTFAPGEVEKIIPVSILGDLLNEADEEFYVQLSNATGASIAVNRAVVTILNDDPLPSLSIANVTVGESTGVSTTAPLTVTSSAPSGQVMTADSPTADGTANANGDYEKVSAKLTFLPASSSGTGASSVGSADGAKSLTITRAGQDLLPSGLRALQGYVLRPRASLAPEPLWETINLLPDEAAIEFLVPRPFNGSRDSSVWSQERPSRMEIRSRRSSSQSGTTATSRVLKCSMSTSSIPSMPPSAGAGPRERVSVTMAPPAFVEAARLVGGDQGLMISSVILKAMCLAQAAKLQVLTLIVAGSAAMGRHGRAASFRCPRARQYGNARRIARADQSGP